ncbi:hypothetical protein SAMN05661096_01840 [Marivirga sericea]|uniref:Uncharacterized protein n=1 Tax=Marivirga sericea TaxID=1028 RepID=A0A1X7JPM7_9BACT|nr:hypothetical protein SAMN05661096_01840 [Marivirga sericea]
MSVIEEEQYFSTNDFLPLKRARILRVLTSITIMVQSSLIMFLEDFQFR